MTEVKGHDVVYRLYYEGKNITLTRCLPLTDKELLCQAVYYSWKKFSLDF